ncbi:peptidase M16 domain-containing protein [Calothrix sp. NIES-2100]|nr:peptidase M16 domain-containing protein [Calothrix sp. NIES-2100]
MYPKQFNINFLCNIIRSQRQILQRTTATILSAVLLMGAETRMAPTKTLQPTKQNTSQELLFNNADNSYSLISNKNSIEITSPSLTAQVRRTVLANGLTVLTKEVHTAPVVSLQVCYQVGLAYEAPSEKGIAHLVEHMLFRKTQVRPVDFRHLLTALGSEFNAWVANDYTCYVDNVESNKLNALLTLEADRMQNSVFDDNGITQEKQVLIAELQATENIPNYRLYSAVMQSAFANHPYGQVLTKADFEKITVEQARNFYRKNYRPDNALIVIVGDFSTEPTLKTIQESFGKIPKGKGMTSREENANKLAFSPNPSLRKSVVINQPGKLPLLALVYPLPDRNHPDISALVVMDYILTSGATSKLHQALVWSGLASEVVGNTNLYSDGGWYFLGVTANLDRKLENVERTIEQVIANLQTQGVTDEQLNRAKKQIQAGTIFSSRNLNSQASLLAYDQSTTGDYRQTDRFLEAVAQVTAADVQRVANQYLKTENRTLGWLKPTKQTQVSGSLNITDFSRITADFRPTKPFSFPEVAKYLPPFPPSTAKSQQAIPQQLTLSNGLQILLLPDSSNPSVSLRGFVRAGQEFDPKEKIGLSTLTAMNLFNQSIWLVEEFENRGGFGLAVQPDREGTYISGISLKADLPFLLETLADVMQYASFPAESLESSRQSYLNALNAGAENPVDAAKQLFLQAIYPANHPLSAPPTQATLKAISREDVVDFYRKYYRPDTTVLALVGDFNPTVVRSQLEAILGSWQASNNAPSASNLPSVSPPNQIVRLRKRLPSQTQSLIVMGYPISNLTESKFYELKILNEILGGSSLSSRLGNELRYHQGLTYTIGCNLQTGHNFGLFTILMQTAPENTEKAIDITLAVLKQLQEQGVSKSEVEIAKQSLVSRYQLALADQDVLAEMILNNQVYGYKPEELHQQPRQIQAVTLNQVNQAVKDFIHPDKIIVISVGAN